MEQTMAHRQVALSRETLESNDTYSKVRSVAYCSPAASTFVSSKEDADVFAIAIFRHDKDSSSCKADDFTWFKIKHKASVAKLKSAYFKANGAHIGLRLGVTILSNEFQMRHLDIFGDRVVVLVAHEECADAPGASTPVVRSPLLPVNARSANVPNSPLLAVKSEPGTENVTSSPFTGSQTVLPSSVSNSTSITSPPFQVTVKKENQTLLSPSRAIADNPAHAPQSSQTNSAVPNSSVSSLASPPKPFIKSEAANEGSTAIDEVLPVAESAPQPLSQGDRIQKIISEATPEVLEAEVRSSQAFLENLLKPLTGMESHSQDTQHWIRQIEALRKQKVDTPTIIGVVGNTGAGKSSVINAMLEEERLVPTNCMRACTAVVTEMSYNHNSDPKAKYRAEIEFIQPSDWEKDLRLSLSELLDSNGQVSRDCTNPESEAGIAYAKIKAVYPSMSRDILATSSVEQLMREPAVRAVLGTVKNIAKGHSDVFYKVLQSYVDSKEKVADGRQKKKGEKRQMEYWPLIKVVRIYTKAEALSTGAVIVDLPGVHDSNAARAAVAAGYMKQCTGLFIVAPINRAVDDKAAKSLLGESFKRQLKFDGTYSRITFICSKTDDISITEASDSLGLEERMSADWERIDEIVKQKRELKSSLAEVKESKAVYKGILDDADDAIEVWEALRDSLEEGETVYDPSTASKKRKRSRNGSGSRRHSKKSKTDSDDENEEEDEDFNDENDSDVEGDSEATVQIPLTSDQIEAKLAQFKEDKKKARRERSELDKKIRETNDELKRLEKVESEIEATMSAICIAGRNNYSKGAIQRDFADGIRELDMESAQEEDPDNFNPEDEIRNYDEVAQSLPVFCVSSRAYQKLQGRLQRDNDVPGFRSIEETEIPQLQAHCKMLTESGRASNCRGFLTNLSQLLTSLSLWSQNDGTDISLSDSQLAAETRWLKTRLQNLEKGLDKCVKECLVEMNVELAENIFDNYPQLIDLAIAESVVTVSNWHRPMNRDDRANGGYYWGTYKAIMRRDGVFSNAQGLHDFNAQLIEPIIKHLASHWEKTFGQRMPRVLQSFTRQSKTLLSAFHREVEARSMKAGNDAARLAMLGQQLRNYESIFVRLAAEMNDVINALQREANREFTPAIARNLSDAYLNGAHESGSGCFSRMKNYTAAHVDQNRSDMFQDACDEVKGRLKSMCVVVEDTMASRTDEVFMSMQRDYMEVISGKRQSGSSVMARHERKMRSDVQTVIEEHNKTADEEAEAALKFIADQKRSAFKIADVASEGIEDNDSSEEDDAASPVTKQDDARNRESTEVATVTSAETLHAKERSGSAPVVKNEEAEGQDIASSSAHVDAMDTT